MLIEIANEEGDWDALKKGKIQKILENAAKIRI